MDLEALVTDELREEEVAGYALEGYGRGRIRARSLRARASRVTPPGRRARRGRVLGRRPVDSVFGAINAATGVDAALREFRIGAVTEGQDALGEVSVVIETGGHRRPAGVAPDIVEAAARAYLRALTIARRRAERPHDSLTRIADELASTP